MPASELSVLCVWQSSDGFRCPGLRLLCQAFLPQVVQSELPFPALSPERSQGLACCLVIFCLCSLCPPKALWWICLLPLSGVCARGSGGAGLRSNSYSHPKKYPDIMIPFHFGSVGIIMSLTIKLSRYKNQIYPKGSAVTVLWHHCQANLGHPKPQAVIKLSSFLCSAEQTYLYIATSMGSLCYQNGPNYMTSSIWRIFHEGSQTVPAGFLWFSPGDFAGRHCNQLSR